jgi:hypothetical protein
MFPAQSELPNRNQTKKKTNEKEGMEITVSIQESKESELVYQLQVNDLFHTWKKLNRIIFDFAVFQY